MAAVAAMGHATVLSRSERDATKSFRPDEEVLKQLPDRRHPFRVRRKVRSGKIIFQLD